MKRRHVASEVPWTVTSLRTAYQPRPFASVVETTPAADVPVPHDLGRLGHSFGTVGVDRWPNRAEDTVYPEVIHAGAGSLVVQRLVYRIGDDRSTLSNASNIASDQENARTPESTVGSIRGFFGATVLGVLGKNEELKIVGHGDGRGHLANMTAADLLQHLMDRGFNPSKHKGQVNLISCLSSVADDLGNTFADTLCFWLRHNGFTNQVIGYQGNVHVNPDSSMQIIPPENLSYYDQLSRTHADLARTLEETGAEYRKKQAEIEELTPPPQSLSAMLAGEPAPEPESSTSIALAGAEEELAEIESQLAALPGLMNEVNEEMNSLFVSANKLRKVAISRVIQKEKKGGHRIYESGNVKASEQRSAQEVEDMERQAFIKRLASRDPNWHGRKGRDWSAHVSANPETPSYIS